MDNWYLRSISYFTCLAKENIIIFPVPYQFICMLNSLVLGKGIKSMRGKLPQLGLLETKFNAQSKTFCSNSVVNQGKLKIFIVPKEKQFQPVFFVLQQILLFNHLTRLLSCFSKENFFFPLEHCLIMGKTEIKRLIFGLRWVLHVLMFSTEQRAPVLLINRPTAFFPFHLPRVHISYGGTCHHLKTPQICFQIRLNGFSLHTEY